MSMLKCLVVVVLMFAGSFASVLEQEEESLHVEVVRKEDDVDVLIVTDREGDPVATINAHPDDEYQLIKPDAEDDHTCLVLSLSEDEGDGSKCYKRVPFQMDEEDVLDLEECDDREVFLLESTECYYFVKRDDGEDTELDHARQKRRSNCYYRHEARTVCRQTTRYCKKYKKGWVFGGKRCIAYGTRCSRYGIDYVRVWKCSKQ